MSAGPFIADALVLAGVAVLTLAVWGLWRLPDTYARLHAASTATVGVALLLLASLTSGQLEMVVRALVVVGFLAITTPVGSHAIARLERELRAQGKGPAEAPSRFLPWTRLFSRMRRSPRGAAGSSRAARPGARPREEGGGGRS